MTLQRVTIRLTELRCLEQSEGSGGSEPYLWTTFFALGAQQLPFQTGPMAVVTPSYDAFRTEFPNGMTAGQAAPVPSFIASANFDMDLDITIPRPTVGCIAVLMEEDSTPQSSIVAGRIAYSKEIEAQLNALAVKRIQSGDDSDIKPEEIETIRNAVEDKVKSAVSSDQFAWGIFTDQDDTIGFAYKAFKHPPDTTTDPQTGEEIVVGADIAFQYFDLPEIRKDDDRFMLTGSVSLGPVPGGTVDLCASERAALKAEQDRIEGLQGRVRLLQDMLHHATPQQKAAIVAEIQATGAEIAQEEARLPELQAALDRCLDRFAHPEVPGGGEPVVLDTH